MRCPFCGNPETKVVDSREVNDGIMIRRRRECLRCKKRFTTYERIESINMIVIKKDGRRELFDKQKIINGLLKACEKRPVTYEQILRIADKIEAELMEKFFPEVKSKKIGELVMRELRKLDKVAYIRFASVYKEFDEPEDFLNEVKKVVK